MTFAGVPTQSEQQNTTEAAFFKWVLVVTEIFNIAVSDIHAKKSARYSQVLVVIELVVSETPCIYEILTSGG